MASSDIRWEEVDATALDISPKCQPDGERVQVTEWDSKARDEIWSKSCAKRSKIKNQSSRVDLRTLPREIVLVSS